MSYFKKNQTINLILVLILPLLIWGPFFPDLIVSISSLIFLIFVFKKKLFFYFNNKPLIIFFIFCIYLVLISTFVATDILISFESSLFYFRIGVFACLIWYLIDKDKNILKLFYYTLVLCFSILVVDGYFQFFFGINTIGLPTNGTRISSFFGDELIMGSFLARLFPLLFALFLLQDKKKFETYFIGILFILVDVLIFISGERTAFLFLNLSTLFIILLIKEHRKFRIITFVCALILISVLSLSSNEISNRMIMSPIKSMGFDQRDKDKKIFTPYHDSHIKTAINMFLDKPVLGHGPKMFRIICKEKKYQVGITPCENHPHNFYIQLLAETGIIGFSFLLSVFIYVIYTSYRQLKSILLKQKIRYLTDYQVCLLAGIMITVWPLSPNGNFFNNWLAITYSLPVGFYLQSLYGKIKN